MRRTGQGNEEGTAVLQSGVLQRRPAIEEGGRMIDEDTEIPNRVVESRRVDDVDPHEPAIKSNRLPEGTRATSELDEFVDDHPGRLH